MPMCLFLEDITRDVFRLIRIACSPWGKPSLCGVDCEQLLLSPANSVHASIKTIQCLASHEAVLTKPSVVNQLLLPGTPRMFMYVLKNWNSGRWTSLWARWKSSSFSTNSIGLRRGLVETRGLDSQQKVKKWYINIPRSKLLAELPRKQTNQGEIFNRHKT